MTEAQLANRLNAASRRYGPKLAVANVLRSLSDEDILSLWRNVGTRVVKDVWRRQRPRLQLVQTIESVMGEMVSVGNSGERKVLGKVTANELRLIAQFRQRMGDTLLEQAKTLRRVADKIAGRTVGEAWAEIGERDRLSLLDAFAIRPLEQRRSA